MAYGETGWYSCVSVCILTEQNSKTCGVMIKLNSIMLSFKLKYTNPMFIPVYKPNVLPFYKTEQKWAKYCQFWPFFNWRSYRIGPKDSILDANLNFWLFLGKGKIKLNKNKNKITMAINRQIF